MKKIKLLTSSVIALSTLVPAATIMTSCNWRGITIIGDARWDRTNSHVRLNRDSTIVLVTKGLKDINGIKSVKVGGNELTSGYEYNPYTNTLKIDAKCMTSTRIIINVDVTTLTPKQKFGRMWDRYLYTYLTSTKEYILDNFTNLWVDGKPVTITDFDYKAVEGVSGAVARLYYQKSTLEYNWFDISLNFYGSWEKVADDFADENAGGKYKFNDDGSLEYSYANGTNTLRKVCINKFGYIYDWYGDSMSVTVNIQGEPQEPTGPAIIGVKIESKTISMTVSNTRVTHADVIYESLSIPANKRGDIHWSVTGTDGVIELDKTVTESGGPLTIMSRKVGSAYLTATVGEYTDTCLVSVTLN